MAYEHQTAASERIASFRRHLRDETSDLQIVRRHITFGSAYAIDEDRLHDLKTTIADHWSVQHSEIYLVGSAKLGFSIAPAKRFRHFNNNSDVDVAIVSHQLYSKLWHELHEFMNAGALWAKRDRFEQYAAWGWLRPDKFPNGTPATRRWWDFFEGLKKSHLGGRYPVRAALYHDIKFLEKYQASAVARCRTTE